ncbi:response regulator transcription factor [Clostridium intestinale]|uniref:Stage 0 sporulation protein A homolog n=1 Tax=Clostridium intestinale TaxID=36845 RepID=A0A7D6VSP7_9CLOT|nr:response regulator transcription factor [Clostridium intestinale]QLY81466.1 response regulator transcription factor [Clostridium intestinale]
MIKINSILIVEDNENICIEISKFFQKNGFYVYIAKKLEDIENMIDKIHVVLLDINLCEEDGFAICKSIRKVSNVPIIFVTVRNSEEDELRAMALGGDDYIKKPYSLPILLSKVKRILYRSKKDNIEELSIKDVTINLVMGQLKAGDKVLEISKNEMKILYYFFLNKGRVIEKDELIEYLWNNKFYVDDNILNVNLSRLRKRLSDIGYNDFIETIPKKGYRIKELDV